MWLKRTDDRRAADPPRPEADPSDGLELNDPALDALGAVLRTLGVHAFDVDGLAADAVHVLFEGWARHVLLGGPVPGVLELTDAAQGARRDWGSLRRFVGEQRIREQRQASQARDDLGQVVWAFVTTMRNMLLHDQESDLRIHDLLSRLARLAADGSADDLRSEVMSAVTDLTRAAEERRRRQQTRLRELGAKVSEVGSQLQQARHEGALDQLTRLFNRRALDEAVTKAVYLRDVFGQTATLVVLDVDHFNWVHDRFGRVAGETMLRGVADCLVRLFPRRIDLVARAGTEKFAVVLTDTRLSDAQRLVERMLAAVRALRSEAEGEQIAITVSAGLAELDRFEEPASWLDRADAALCQAKLNGRDRAELARPRGDG